MNKTKNISGFAAVAAVIAGLLLLGAAGYFVYQGQKPHDLNNNTDKVESKTTPIHSEQDPFDPQNAKYEDGVYVNCKHGFQVNIPHDVYNYIGTTVDDTSSLKSWSSFRNGYPFDPDRTWSEISLNVYDPMHTIQENTPSLISNGLFFLYPETITLNDQLDILKNAELNKKIDKDNFEYIVKSNNQVSDNTLVEYDLHSTIGKQTYSRNILSQLDSNDILVISVSSPISGLSEYSNSVYENLNLEYTTCSTNLQPE